MNDSRSTEDLHGLIAGLAAADVVDALNQRHHHRAHITGLDGRPTPADRRACGDDLLRAGADDLMNLSATASGQPSTRRSRVRPCRRRIRAGVGADEVDAGAGNDRIKLGGGDDIAYGYGGDDTIYGFGGNDWIHGGGGADLLFGGDGDDVLKGGSGENGGSGDAGFDECALPFSLCEDPG